MEVNEVIRYLNSKKHNKLGAVFGKTKNRALRHEIVFIFSTISIIPILVLALFMYSLLFPQIRLQKQSLMENINQMAVVSIESKIEGSVNQLKSLSSMSSNNVILEEYNSNGEIKDIVRYNTALMTFENVVKESKDLYESIIMTDKSGKVIMDTLSIKHRRLDSSISKTDYYNEVIEGKEIAIGAAYKSKDERTVLPVAYSIKSSDRILGIIVLYFDIQQFTSIIDLINTGEKGGAFLVDKNSNILYSKQGELIMSNINSIVQRPDTSNIAKGNSNIVDINGIPAYIYESNIEKAQWTVMTFMHTTEYNKEIVSFNKLIIIAILILVVLIFIIALIYSNSISVPIRNIIDYMQKVESGDLSIEASFKTRCELSSLRDNFNNMVGRLRSIISNTYTTSEILENVSHQLKAESRSSDELNNEVLSTIDTVLECSIQQQSIIRTGEMVIKDFTKEFSDMRKYTERVNHESNEINSYIDNGLGELEALIGQASKSNSLMNEINTDVNCLSEELKQINGITDTIKSITKQINLLSLNATIEAARAGDSGKGFMVVAEEIKKLAVMTSSKTEEIDLNINSIFSKMQVVLSDISEIKFLIDNQNTCIGVTEKAFHNVIDKVDEINRLLKYITDDIQRLNMKRDSVDDTMKCIAELSEQNLSIAKDTKEVVAEHLNIVESLSKNANSIKDISNNLREYIACFKIKECNINNWTST